MEEQARDFLALGARNVLIKGGHGEGDESVDLLVGQGQVRRFAAEAHRHQEHPRHRLHAVVGDRRRPRQGPRARRRRAQAKAYVTAAIAGADALAVGHGHGPLHHFYQAMEYPMTTRRNFITGAGLTLAGAVAAPAIAARRDHGNGAW